MGDADAVWGQVVRRDKRTHSGDRTYILVLIGLLLHVVNCNCLSILGELSSL